MREEAVLEEEGGLVCKRDRLGKACMGAARRGRGWWLVAGGKILHWEGVREFNPGAVVGQ